MYDFEPNNAQNIEGMQPIFQKEGIEEDLIFFELIWDVFQVLNWKQETCLYKKF